MIFGVENHYSAGPCAGMHFATPPPFAWWTLFGNCVCLRRLVSVLLDCPFYLLVALPVALVGFALACGAGALLCALGIACCPLFSFLAAFLAGCIVMVTGKFSKIEEILKVFFSALGGFVAGNRGT